MDRTDSPTHVPIWYRAGRALVKEPGSGVPPRCVRTRRRQYPGRAGCLGVGRDRAPWAAQAGLARARTLVGDLGRFSEGETVLFDLLGQPGPQADEIRHTLSELYFWEGRRTPFVACSEQSWASAADQVIELRDHWRLDSSPVLMEKVLWEVDQAVARAPDDDRVWLAQASLAMQSGRFDEAGSLLDRCIERRPDDPDVWRVRAGLGARRRKTGRVPQGARSSAS